MADTEYDILFLGGGPGGYVGAIRASQLGARVAVVERDRLGGTCLNRGCIPTKTWAWAAEVYLEAQRAGEVGVEVGEVMVDFARMAARKNQVVDRLVAGIAQLLKAGKIDLYRGHGRLTSPRSVMVNDNELRAKKVIIATGSVPARVPIPGLDLPGVVTSDEILEIVELPPSLVVIGGGIIGVEFASIFVALGTKVTIVEMLPQILPPVDDELTRRLSQVLRGQGVEVNTSATVKEIRQKGEGLEVVFDTAQGERQVEAATILVAVGRWPYTEGLGLAELGVKMERRAVAVNEHLETSIPDLYAIGDANGGIMLAHVASYQGEVAVENILGRRRAVDYRAVPNCIFTIPELAGVGLTEREAKDKGLAYKVSRFPFSALGRAQTMGETTGVVKMLCHAETGQVLGVHIMGPRATDLIAEAALAIQLEATAKDIVDAIHAHPTLSEALREAAMGQLEGSIHALRF